MVVNDTACLLAKRSAFESIASKLAPTVLALAHSRSAITLKRQPSLHHCQQVGFRQRHRVQLHCGLLDRL
ncbi:hypothetical protein PMI31_05846 [Pseudomonas sp. GM55]|nr:hypothetical protein PMI31_05846 [Pseudomonas sp. GM55]